VLVLMSERLRGNMRFYDTPFRYGGEEFVIILSDTDAPEAIVLGNRLRELISSKPFDISDTLRLPITVSIGIACLDETDDERGRSLLNRADQNLLQAKTSGRNQVVISAIS
jgi:two-component system, cell cycle response regulator